MSTETSVISSSSTPEVSTSNNNAQASNNVASSTAQPVQTPTPAQVSNHSTSLFGVVKGKIVQPFKTRTVSGLCIFIAFFTYSKII